MLLIGARLGGEILSIRINELRACGRLGAKLKMLCKAFEALFAPIFKGTILKCS